MQCGCVAAPPAAAGLRYLRPRVDTSPRASSNPFPPFPSPACRSGIVLVSPCYTDLGLPSEAAAGWYNRPWQWDKIKVGERSEGRWAGAGRGDACRACWRPPHPR
jgi:hypothetical protein